MIRITENELDIVSHLVTPPPLSDKKSRSADCRARSGIIAANVQALFTICQDLG